MNEKNLGIPIYLDTNTLLDLLASMENGFSKANKTTTSNIESSSSLSTKGGGFGINFSSLIQLGLNGSKSDSDGIEQEKHYEEEKFHTYGSLMNRLIQNLDKQNLIKKIDAENWDNIKESDFIKVQGKFISNPLSTSLTQTSNLIDFFIKIFDNELFSQNIVKDEFENLKGKARSKAIKEIKRQNEKQIEEFKIYKDMVDKLYEESTDDKFQKYVVRIKDSENEIVCYLFNEFMRDKAGIELPFGEFKILGKVTRKLCQGESIDLLEGNILGSNAEFLESITDTLENIEGVYFPEIFTKVEAPAIQIIPIAIYI